MWFAAKPTASLLFLLLPLVMSCEQMEEPTVKVAQGDDPEEVGSWNGIRNATSYSSNCIQKSLDTQNVTGDEDCLYLNVFTAGPAESWNSSKRPVIVWFHGGAFVVGSGNMENRRPDPLLRHGIVFVSVNYRLGVM
ncbi:Acetylcholinesterase, partial [Gryllus bimaculatus]